MATDVVELQLEQHSDAIADLQRTCDQLQQQLALMTQALLYAARGQSDAASFGLQSMEAIIVALNPALQGKVNAVPFGRGQ
jgi:hypothetical protein